MSHPVNDEILENLYEEVKEEFPNALEPLYRRSTKTIRGDEYMNYKQCIKYAH